MVQERKLYTKTIISLLLPSNIEKRWKAKTLEEKEKNLIVDRSHHPKNYALLIQVICPRDMPWPQNYKRYNAKGFRQHVVEVRNSGFVTVKTGMWHTPPSHTPNTNKTLVEQEGFDFFFLVAV